MKNIFFKKISKEKIGFFNLENQKIIDFKFEDSKEFINGICWVKLNNFWKLINFEEKDLINKKIEEVLFFNETISVVKYENSFFVIFNKDLKEIKLDYEFIDFNNDFLLVKKDNQYFFLDKDFKILNKVGYTNALNFNNEFAPVSNNNFKWGIINKKNKLIIDYFYDQIFQYNSNLFKVIKNNEVFFIDINNQIYLNNLINIKFNDNFCSNYLVFNKKNKFGIFNEFFETVFLKKIDDLFNFENNIAIFKKNLKFGLINSSGKIILKPNCFKIHYQINDYYFLETEQNNFNYFNFKIKKMIY